MLNLHPLIFSKHCSPSEFFNKFQGPIDKSFCNISGTLFLNPSLKIILKFEITKTETVIKITLNITLNLFFLFLKGRSIK